VKQLQQLLDLVVFVYLPFGIPDFLASGLEKTEM